MIDICIGILSRFPHRVQVAESRVEGISNPLTS